MSVRFTLPTLPTFSTPPSESPFASPMFGGSVNFNPYAGIKMSAPPSTEQMLEKLLAKKRGHQGGSFLDQVESGAGSLLDKAMNVISRPNWAIASAFDRGLKGGSWVKGFETGIEGKTHTTFGDVLAHNHILDGHKWLRAGLGLGLDVALDPTTYLFGAGVMADAGKFGLRAGLHEIEKKGAASVAEHAGQFQKALAVHEQQVAERNLIGKAAAKVVEGKPVTPLEKVKIMSEATKTASLERLAKVEHDIGKKKYLELRFGVTKAKSIGLQTPLRLRKSHLAILESTGAFAKVRHAAGHTFLPGYEDPLAHAALITARHQTERLHQEFWDQVAKPLLEPFGHSMTEGDMQKALFAGEKAGTVKGAKIMVTKMREELAKQGFEGPRLEEALNFTKTWHEITQHLLQSEKLAGVKHAAPITDRLYVPHVYDRAQMGKPATISQIGQKGFEKARTAKDLSFEQQIALAGKRGFKGPAETNPISLMAARIRQGAAGAATANLRETLRDAVGVTERTFNPNLRGKAFRRVAARQEKLDAVTKAIETAPKRLRGARAKLGIQHKQELADAAQKVQDAKDEVKRLTKRGLGPNPSKTAKATRASRIAAAKKRVTKAEKYLNETLPKKHIEDKNTLGITHAGDVHRLELEKAQLEDMITKLSASARRRMWQKNPEAFREGLMHVAKLDKRTPDGLVIKTRIPAHLAENIDRVEHVLTNDEAMNRLTQAVGKATSEWKMLVTTVNPGYRIRNTLSDFWNMYIAGVPTWAIPVYGRKAGKLMMRAAGKSGTEAQQIEARRFLQKAHDHGVLSGLFQGDIAEQTKRVTGQTSKYKRVTNFTVHQNVKAENWGRLVHYMYRVEREGMHPSAAAAQVRMAHFDYEDLTRVEQNLFKKYVPFYTWTRKNVPYQLQQLASRPGRVASYTKLAQESEQASGVKPGDIVGSALQGHPLAFKFGSGYLDPQIGLADLQRVQDKNQLLSMITPAIGAPIQALTNQNWFTGNKIKDTHAMNPTSNILADIGGNIPIIDKLFGQTTRFVPGKGYEKGPGINPYADFALGQLPLINYLKNKDNPLRSSSESNRDLSYIGGISYVTPNPTAEKYYATLGQSDYLKQAIQDLRDLGIFPEPKHRKPSDFQKILNQIAYSQIGRR